MSNNPFTPLVPGTPVERSRGGMRGGGVKTRFYRDQLQANPGQWFIWKADSNHGSDAGAALKTLLGVTSLRGLDRNTLAYKATTRKQENGLYTTYVCYVAENDSTSVLYNENAENVVKNPFSTNI